MANSCRRPLDNAVAVETFLFNVLEIKPGQKEINRIVEIEASLDKFEQHPTSTHTEYRHREYRTMRERKILQKQILKELIELERLPSDDNIVLGAGGARPTCKKPSQKATAYIVSGAPASGKSGVAAKLADKTKSFVLDSDYAKRKFPEFWDYACGASLVHKEADAVIFGKEDSLLEFCVYNRYNVVIPVVGRTEDSIEEIRHRLDAMKYTVHLITVALDRYECTRRAYRRFLESDRYVPLSYVFDEVGNEPERIYYAVERMHQNNSEYVSYTLLSNDVPKGTSPKVVAMSGQSPYGKKPRQSDDKEG